MKRSMWILGAGWLVFLLFCYPGFLKHDGASMLADSRTGAFTDAHSPMMSEVWRVIGIVISGPAGVLFVQSLLLLLASYALLARVLAPRNAAIAAVAILLFPPILGTTALVCPESLLPGLLLAGALALLDERRWLHLVGLGALLVACGLRDGAAFAVLPIVVMTLRWRDLAGWRRYALAFASWLVIWGAAAGISHLLVDDDADRNETALALHDLVGTIARAEPVGDAELRALLGDVALPDAPGIQARARNVYGKPLDYTSGDQRVFEDPEEMEQRDALIAARRDVVLAMPAAYLGHRASHFAKVLGFTNRWSPLYLSFVPTPELMKAVSHGARSSLLQRTLQVPVRVLSRTFLFRPYVYAVVALVLLTLAIVRRHRIASLLAISAVLYELSLMFVTTRIDFRDSNWMIVATVLGSVLLAAAWWKSRQARTA